MKPMYLLAIFILVAGPIILNYVEFGGDYILTSIFAGFVFAFIARQLNLQEQRLAETREAVLVVVAEEREEYDKLRREEERLAKASAPAS